MYEAGEITHMLSPVAVISPNKQHYCTVRNVREETLGVVSEIACYN